MKSKIFIVISLLAVLLVGMSACSNSSGDNPPTQSHSKSNKTSHSKSIPKSNNSDDPTNNSSTSSTQSPSKNVNSSNENNKSEDAFYGQWQIKKAIAFGPAGTYSSDDIKALTGKQLTFSKDSATCFGDKIEDMNNTVHNPVYKKTVIAKKDFPSNYRVTFDKLGIGEDSVTGVNVTGTKGICSVFFITQDKNKLILNGGGVFFELDRSWNAVSKNNESAAGDKKDKETLSKYANEQIEYARVWLQLGTNQQIDELNVRHIPAGTPLNANDDTSVGYPEDVIQLAGSRLVDGSVTYSGNGDGTINIYNVPLRWDGSYPAGEKFYTDIINNTKLVHVDPGDDEEIIKLIKMLK